MPIYRKSGGIYRQENDDSTYICTIFPDQLGKRSNVPQLRHAEDCTGPAHQECNEGCNAHGQLGRIVPGVPVVPAAQAEDEPLFENDGDPDRDPVSHKCEEVGEDLGQVAPPRQRADDVDDYANGVPNSARDLLRVPAQDLEVDAGGVCRRNGVGDQPEGDDYGAELAESVQRAEPFDDEGACTLCVCRAVFYVGLDTGGEPNTGEEGQGEGDHQAGQG